MREASILIALLAVGLGAAAGACVRWALSEALNSRLSFIPAGTLAANLIGAFAIGVLLALFAGRPVSPQVKLFLMTGLLGGLTTFSTFSSETCRCCLRASTCAPLHTPRCTFSAALPARRSGLRPASTFSEPGAP